MGIQGPFGFVVGKKKLTWKGGGGGNKGIRVRGKLEGKLEVLGRGEIQHEGTQQRHL